MFRSRELSRTDRERLVAQGFLREVIKGWLLSASPGDIEGDTTPWYASFWEFCAAYCRERFGHRWHLSPEQSLLLHAQSTVIPRQIIICTPEGKNNTIQLPFGTSLYDLRKKKMPPREDIVIRNGLRLDAPAAALVRVPEKFYTAHPVEARVVLATIEDSSELLGRLLDGGHSVVAGRLAGALRHVGRREMADDIVETMKAAGYDVRETDPFDPELKPGALAPGVAPIVGRLEALWESARDAIIAVLPRPPGLPGDLARYMRFIEEIYESDAYHSLSIEGYSVTPALVDRVRSGAWDPDGDRQDWQNRDALAARGYWQAFQLVKSDVEKIVGGADAARIASSSHRGWYRALFEPSVAVGLLRAGALAGYRHHPVYLRGSRHVPPNHEVVPEAMDALFDLLSREPEPGVRAVLGHWLFGYVHPYPDGNGRMARFLMNAMLASGGYHWTVIRVEDRDPYLAALESASVGQDFEPFARFIASRINWSAQHDADA